ncbi:cobalt/nickel transport system ATP-binding protein [Desulfosarcina sp. BuS5]|uniref:energy-coupling factor ABC transporter ATP-binding protein n=1 Tax=Desulfosarcina sp. BuS5 TaxID=933262 RepID=UPI000484DC5A|nr:ABC transporter ATP-binding protein [Desulfosarcina sp. BuS5]WDN88724.1 cobalt/nickel transport system ATP-binding protein [Desulfosarcina sp. BuS5]
MDRNNLVINLTDICYSYPGGKKVLDNLNLELCQGRKLGLVGPNGGGKTTLLHIIMGLLKPSSGSIEIFGQPVVDEKDFKKIRQKTGLLFQDSDDQLFSPTVLEDVAFGPLNLGKTKEEAVETAKKTLNFLGLSGFEDRVTYKLSGGEKRLVSLATVLAMEPEILLLDEPTTGLDDATKARIVDLLEKLPLSLIMISHESDLLERITDSIINLENGRIITDKEFHIHQHTHPHLSHL